MNLPVVDLIVFAVYVIAIVALGSWYMRKSRTSKGFMVASGSLPGWAVGLSVFGTYLSSNTFIGVVGQAFGGNWNFFVYSLGLPVAAWIGVRFFVPFYRQGNEISAYHHMESRFGLWARTYCVVCYLLIQLSRIATITFGIALALQALTGWSMTSIIIITGATTTLYTLLGGIEAVIWTDVAQSFILIGGALLLLLLILFGMPGGPGEAIAIAYDHNKFSLGTFDLSISKSTFWVVFLFALFMNIKAFGFDQNYVQRYLTARSDREARKALWLGALLYVPISLLFFFIGSVLFSYYHAQPELLVDLKQQSAIELIERDPNGLDDAVLMARVQEAAASLNVADIGDKALPHFMTHRLPVGVAGLIMAAIAAAAMSSLSTSLNSSATILLIDVYKRYWRPNAGERESMRFLHGATLFCGMFGTGAAIAMIGVQSILAAWWQLTGIFAGAMLGLFLLGFIVRKVNRPAAVTSVIVGVLLIVWMTFSPNMEYLPEFLRSPFHANMIVVISTLSMFLIGLLISRLKKNPTY